MLESSPGFIFLTALFIAFSGALIPGPFLTIDISETVRHGFKAGPLLVTGHAIAELVLVLALVLGLTRVINQEWLTASISLAGGLFLLWMAVGMIRVGRGSMSPLRPGAVAAISNSRTVLTGILASVLNPTWLIWWATIGLTLVVWAMKQGPMGLVYFFSGHILADFSWYGFVSFLVVRGRKFWGDSLHRGLLIGCGLFLIVLGVYFIFKGGQFWVGNENILALNW